MELAPLITLSLFLLLLSLNLASGGCSTSKCGDTGRNPDIRFPFMVKDHDSMVQASSCGYPGFAVQCDDDQGSKQTLIVIELPNSGNFSVKSIDYIAQEILVNDINNCLPKKLLSFNLSNSPFSMVYHHEFSFLNCSSILVTNDDNNSSNNKININNNDNININNNKNVSNDQVPIIIGPIPCLSGVDYFVYAIPLNNNNNNITGIVNTTTKCYMVAPMVKVPVQWPPPLDNETELSSISTFENDLRLSWFMPACRSCELHGQMCSMGTNSSELVDIVCSETENKGRPKKMSLTTTIAVVLAICSPSIICIVASLYIWTRAYVIKRSSVHTSSELEPESVVTSTARQGRVIELGLEDVNVEFARQIVRLGLRNEAGPGPPLVPTILLSEMEKMGQSPSKEGDNVCSICMVDYESRDRLGTLPMCGHCFHAHCINVWLLSRGIIERTCPICRARVNS